MDFNDDDEEVYTYLNICVYDVIMYQCDLNMHTNICKSTCVKMCMYTLYRRTKRPFLPGLRPPYPAPLLPLFIRTMKTHIVQHLEKMNTTSAMSSIVVLAEKLTPFRFRVIRVRVIRVRLSRVQVIWVRVIRVKVRLPVIRVWAIRVLNQANMTISVKSLYLARTFRPPLLLTPKE
jgi:hypothetical protein